MAAVHTLDESRFGYLKQADVARLADAYRFSEAAHKGQTRQSGDPYISHPLAVAEILAGWHLDGQALSGLNPFGIYELPTSSGRNRPEHVGYTVDLSRIQGLSQREL